AMTASLLGVDTGLRDAADRRAFLAAFAGAAGVRQVGVRKRRTQYVLGGGWIEVADLEFPSARVRSIGVQSPRLSDTRRLRGVLDPGRELEPLGYVAACRRWA